VSTNWLNLPNTLGKRKHSKSPAALAILRIAAAREAKRGGPCVSRLISGKGRGSEKERPAGQPVRSFTCAQHYAGITGVGARRDGGQDD